MIVVVGGPLDRPGYAFGTMRFRGDTVAVLLLLLGIIFPYEATVIPLYYDFQRPSA